jgi:DNA-binding response OmpR family regulator
MSARVVIVRDGLEGAAPWMTQVLRDASMNVRTISGAELADAAPSDVLLLRIPDRQAVAACWTLHRQGHRSVIAVSGSPSSKECIHLLNAGADYYLDAWLPAAELVARVRVVLRFTAWLDERTAIASVQQVAELGRRDVGAAEDQGDTLSA